MPHSERNLSLFGATAVGVGAIVGGGILALAGVAFAVTGPSAIVAFAINGLIAALTALSFAEMSAAFPESGGTYTFAKKVLTVETAFTVGWIVWFASIVAAVLYALGFGAFAHILLQQIWPQLAPADVSQTSGGSWIPNLLGIGATAYYSIGLMRKNTGSGQWATVGKVVVFVVLILAGVWALAGTPVASVTSRLSPFFSNGATGLIQAMGYTFVALQGFDLIAAVGGEVRNPGHIIPRAMLLSLGIALGIYLPLLFIVSTVGVSEGLTITEVSARDPEGVIAYAAQHYLGTAGFWLVLVAAVLSMLSALQANLFAASRVALAMSRDQTLPGWLGKMHALRKTPVVAVAASAGAVGLILLVVPGVAAAGAVSSLIFLITFALAHWTSILTRLRGGGGNQSFQTPWFPLVPATGLMACLALALFQGFAVPLAGLLAATWVGIGACLFFFLFARHARIVDASVEARDPQLVRLRGRSPLVLVPIANPDHAAAMVAVATALAPPQVGRVLLLSVVTPPPEWKPGQMPAQLIDAQTILGRALAASFASSLSPEALTTVAQRPWQEISRVAQYHGCESLLLGFSRLRDEVLGTPLEELISTVDCDVVLLRALPGWNLKDVQRVLVPIGGRGGHDALRARLLGSLHRSGVTSITFLRVVPEGSSKKIMDRASRQLSRLAGHEAAGNLDIQVVQSNSPDQEIARRSAEYDLLVLGLQRLSRRRKTFGETARAIARTAECSILLISRRG